MITDRTAQRIASEWASGGDALQQLASTGAITDPYETFGVLLECYGDKTEDRDLDRLAAYIEHHGPRGPQPDWYERTIARQN